MSLLVRALTVLGLDDHGQPTGSRRVEAEESLLGARILLSLAFATHQLDDTDRAARALDDASAIADATGRDEMRVLVHAQRGAMLIRQGALHDALAELDAAIGMVATAPPIDQAKMLLNRGELHGLLGNLAQAKADCARALQIAIAAGPTELSFYATHNLGWYEFLSGDLPRALELMPSGDDAHSDFERGIVGMDRSKVLLAAGLVAEADQTLIEVCAAFGRTELVQFLAEAELTRAEVALLADKVELARTLSRGAVERLRGRHNERALALGELVQLRADAARGDTRTEVVQSADRLADTFLRLRLPHQNRMARLIAFADAAPGDRHHRSPPRVGLDDPLDLRLHHRRVRAALAFARGNATDGRRHARRGLAELADHQTQFGSLDLQTSSAAHGVELATLAIAEEVERGRASAVLGWLERARAISARVPEVHPPADPVTADLLSQLRWVVNQLSEVKDTSAARGLIGSRTELQHQIRSRSWTLHGSGAVESIPTTTAIRTALGRATLVAIFVLRRHVYALVLSGQRCWLRELTTITEMDELTRRLRADLDVLAMDRVQPLLRTAAQRSFATGLAAVGRKIIDPLGLPAGPLVILPAGRLSAIPWGSLPALRGRPVTVAPSATAWMRSQSRQDQRSDGVLAVAGPGLTRASAEVADIARTWPHCTTLVGEDATDEAVLSGMDGARIVHVAAHGHHQQDSPLFSSIRLFDGPLVGYDLERLRRPPQQVVLSACDLGQATVRPGDEALGLTRALLHNGTSTVISGVAKVSDRGAAELMVDYHRRLAGGSPPAYALADALAATDEPLPFVCFGAGW